MFIHPEDLYSAEKMRIAELIRKRELERLVRLSHPRQARDWSIGRHAMTVARRCLRAIIELIIGSQHAPAQISTPEAGPESAPESTIAPSQRPVALSLHLRRS